MACENKDKRKNVFLELNLHCVAVRIITLKLEKLILAINFKCTESKMSLVEC